MKYLLFSQVWPIFVHGHEGGGAHAVASVEHILLACVLEDKIQLGGEVIPGHLIPGKVPEAT